MARTHEFILPSGVYMKVRNLTGLEQGIITDQSKGVSRFDEMLANCTLQLGDNTNVNENNIKRMLVNDKKYALVELRQFSLRFRDKFKFNYEWPVKGGKSTQEYEVEFTRESFKMIPYRWVREEMERLEKETPGVLKALEETRMYYPEMYKDYTEMLDKNKVQEFETEDGELLKWNVLTSESENKFSESALSFKNINVRFAKRDIKVKGANGIEMNWDFNSADIYITEQVSSEIIEVEGQIDTSLTIQNQKDPSQQARVDLTATSDFFFPSLAR